MTRRATRARRRPRHLLNRRRPQKLLRASSASGAPKTSARTRSGLFRKAGVAKIGREFLGGEYEGQVEGAADLCKGAKPKQHSHGFEADGAFASYDQDGQQVDDGTYTKVNGRTFTLGEPPVPVRYRIKGDTATFDVVVPDCQNARCRESTAYVVSAFFPADL
jgi:hypothetical protein